MEVFDLFVKEIWLIAAIIAGIVVEFFALTWAYFEVQIEGDKSWAGGLPCWRKKYSWFSKEITGYHVSLMGLMIAIMLLTFTAIAISSMLIYPEIFIAINIFKLIAAVLLSISILVTMHEDFLWNAINPSPKFGVKGFTKKYPEVGKTIFIWFVPIDYIMMTLFSFVIAYLIGMTMIWLVIFSTMLVITTSIATRRYIKDTEHGA